MAPSEHRSPDPDAHSAGSHSADAHRADAHTAPGPVVRTTSGRVQGVIDEDLSGRRVQKWLSVRFGQNTTGHRRFRAPERAWEASGIYVADHYRPPAMQPTYTIHTGPMGSEDCLHLDIVRPDTDDELPVVIYFHGGSFIRGASYERMLRGLNLATAMNVVYVSVNFRLGALGYLDLRSLGPDCEPNPAVADQVLAIDWVLDNIAGFGGDIGNVTLMGESAGGASVTTLMGVPGIKNRIHRDIAQSPPATLVHSRAQSALWARHLTRRLGLGDNPTIDQLRAVGAVDIIRASSQMILRQFELIKMNSSFAPTVDGTFVPRHPIDTFDAGRQAHVPLLIGTNSDEASFSKALYLRTSARSRAALRILRDYDPDNAEAVLEAYDGATDRVTFAEFIADALFWASSVQLAGAHAHSGQSVYMYRFDYAPKVLRWLGLGAMHSLELSNIFGDHESSRASGIAKISGTDGVEEVTETMQRQWAHFIHHGRPDDDWPQYLVGDQIPYELRRATMVFDEHPHVIYNPKPERRRAWELYDMRDWGRGRPELLSELGIIDPRATREDLA